jgi:hypothetical protein
MLTPTAPSVCALLLSDDPYYCRLRAAIGCPDTWTRFEQDPAFRRVLFRYWEEVAERHQIGWPMDHYDQLTAVIRRSEEALKGIEFDAPTWRPRAITEYKSRTSFFSSFRHTTEKEHNKHWTVAETPLKKLVQGTLSGPAKFFYQYSLATLEFALYDAVRFNWRRIAEQRIPFLFVNFRHPVGASEGAVTQHVRFALTYETGLVHSQPILPCRKPATDPWLSEVDGDIWPDMNELERKATLDDEWEH